jgi:hypothetical protein
LGLSPTIQLKNKDLLFDVVSLSLEEDYGKETLGDWELEWGQFLRFLLLGTRCFKLLGATASLWNYKGFSCIRFLSGSSTNTIRHQSIL